MAANFSSFLSMRSSSSRKPLDKLSNRSLRRIRLAHKTIARKSVIKTIPTLSENVNDSSEVVDTVSAVLLEKKNLSSNNEYCYQEQNYKHSHQVQNNDQTYDIDDSSNSSITSDDSYETDDSECNFNNEIDKVNCENYKSTFREELRDCFLEINLNHVQGNAILKLLKSHKCFINLPSDSRTLLSTPRKTLKIQKFESGEYVHLGVESVMLESLKNENDSNIPDTLIVDFSTDGATIDRTGVVQMWPIQIRITNMIEMKPLVVGIYHGKSKPSSANKFFESFVREINSIYKAEGIMINNRKIKISLRCFIADAPARAFILNHIGHKSIHSCSKCQWNGKKFVARTDDDYLNQLDSNHHHGESPLSTIKVGMVSQVPFDYMHLALLGVNKKILKALVGPSKFSKNVKMSKHHIVTVNHRLYLLKSYCPREFSRLPEAIADYGRYKATEHRQFCLYTGPVVLNGILKDIVYDHFLLFHSALRCLVSANCTKDHLLYANAALRVFVEKCETIYGPRFHSYNIHGLLHLVDDVKNFGPLDEFSAFCYENNMRILRKFCRKPGYPLQQMVYRMAELSYATPLKKKSKNNVTELFQIHTEGPLTNNLPPNVIQYRLLKKLEFSLGLKLADNCCMLYDSTICIIENIIKYGNDILLIVRKFEAVKSWFNVGIESSIVDSYHCSKITNNFMCINLKEVRAKCFRMPFWQKDSLEPMDPIPDEFVVSVLL